MDQQFSRRTFLQASACAGVASVAAKMLPPKKTHLVTLSFDDGFKKSFYKTADIYEEFGLRGCFNVIATGHLEQFHPVVDGVPDTGIVPFPKGDFSDWNALKKRGHEVMAHTYNHVNLTTIPFEEAKELIVKCADYFEAHLDGFREKDSVYNFAYNASTPELDAFALEHFLVVRTQGDFPTNPIPTHRKPVRIGCWSHGPENCDQFFDDSLNEFLKSPGGWFVFNTHGLDDEGWGPMSSDYLRKLLARLTKLPHVEVVPAGEVVRRLASCWAGIKYT